MAPGIPQDRIISALDRVETWTTAHGCPGGSVAISDGSGVVDSRGIGHRTLDPHAPATSETQYAVGSVAKPITALAVCLLDERDHIDVHDPVASYVPVFEDAPGGPITVHQLLSHTAGMPDDDLAFAGGELDSWEEFREFLAETVDRRRENGERFLYYNSGYTVLVRLVEVVSETDFPTFVERELFDPLGMEQSTFDPSVLEDDAADVMVPHVQGEDGFEAVSVTENPIFGNPLLNGPGGLYTSVTDLVAFVEANIGDAPTVNGVSLERLHEPASTRKRLVDGTEYTYGYGWERRPLGSDTVVGHSGNTGSSAGFIGFLVEHEVGIALGWNAKPTERPWVIGSEALAVLAGMDPDKTVPNRSLAADISDLTGRYESYTGENHVTVRGDGASLTIELGGDVDSVELQFTVSAVDENHYSYRSVDGFEETPDVEFFRTDDGVELLFEGALLQQTGSAEDK